MPKVKHAGSVAIRIIRIEISYKNWPILNEMVLRGNIEAINTLIQKGANPYWKGTRERKTEEDKQFDEKFHPDTVWWMDMDAMTLSELLLGATVRECLKQNFQHN